MVYHLGLCVFSEGLHAKVSIGYMFSLGVDPMVYRRTMWSMSVLHVS